MGEAYLQMRDADAAKAEAERALTLEPTASAATQLLERISSR